MSIDLEINRILEFLLGCLSSIVTLYISNRIFPPHLKIEEEIFKLEKNSQIIKRYVKIKNKGKFFPAFNVSSRIEYKFDNNSNNTFVSISPIRHFVKAGDTIKVELSSNDSQNTNLLKSFFDNTGNGNNCIVITVLFHSRLGIKKIAYKEIFVAK